MYEQFVGWCGRYGVPHIWLQAEPKHGGFEALQCGACCAVVENRIRVTAEGSKVLETLGVPVGFMPSVTCEVTFRKEPSDDA